MGWQVAGEQYPECEFLSADEHLVVAALPRELDLVVLEFGVVDYAVAGAFSV